MSEVKKILNTKKAAEYVGLAEQSLHNRRHLRRPPSYFKVGSRVLYDIKDLDQFLEDCRIEIPA